MKKITYTLITVLFVSFASCTSSKLIINEFTTTGEIYNLRIGMSEAEVISTLGLQPFELQYNFEDQSKILMWNYRRPHHEVNREVKNTMTALTIQNSKWKDEEILHVHITGGKLANFYTRMGSSNSQGLINDRFELRN
jgi:hypothetical protein